MQFIKLCNYVYGEYKKNPNSVDRLIAEKFSSGVEYERFLIFVASKFGIDEKDTLIDFKIKYLFE